MLKQRLISAGVALPIAIAAFWFGEPWFTALILAGAILGSLEFYRLVNPEQTRGPTYVLGPLWSALLVIIHHMRNQSALPLAITIVVVVSLLWLLLRRPKKAAFLFWSCTIAGAFYVGWLLSYWVLLRGLSDGRDWALLAILATITCDSSAFFVGTIWGRHRMAPSISPKKTWEGAAGGALGTIAACALLKVILQLPVSYVEVAMLGFTISLFAQLGDLVVSLLKRNAGVKDAGTLVPGHGGVLDRIGSTIFSGFAVYYFLLWVVL